MNIVLESQPVPEAKEASYVEETKYYLNLELVLNKDIVPETMLMQILEFVKGKTDLQSVRISTNRW